MEPLIPLTIIISGVVVVQAGHLPRLPHVVLKSTQITNEIITKEGAFKHLSTVTTRRQVIPMSGHKVTTKSAMIPKRSESSNESSSMAKRSAEIFGRPLQLQEEENNAVRAGQPPRQRESSTEVDDGSLLTRVNSGINAKEGNPMSTNRFTQEGTTEQHLSTANQASGHWHQVSTAEIKKMKKSEVPTKSLMTKRRYRRSFGYKTKCIPMKMKKCQMFKVNGLVKEYCVTYATVLCTALD